MWPLSKELSLVLGDLDDSLVLGDPWVEEFSLVLGDPDDELSLVRGDPWVRELSLVLGDLDDELIFVLGDPWDGKGGASQLHQQWRDHAPRRRGRLAPH